MRIALYEELGILESMLRPEAPMFCTLWAVSLSSARQKRCQQQALYGQLSVDQTGPVGHCVSTSYLPRFGPHCLGCFQQHVYTMQEGWTGSVWYVLKKKGLPAVSELLFSLAAAALSVIRLLLLASIVIEVESGAPKMLNTDVLAADVTLTSSHLSCICITVPVAERGKSSSLAW